MMPLQAVMLALSGRGKVVVARAYWSGICRCVGLRLRVTGHAAPLAERCARPTVFVSNHTSWLDVAALGGRLEGCFVAKEDVAGWPVIGTVARLGRTVFVRRRRGSTARERDGMQTRLASGDNLILFPEGTTADGLHVMAFRSAFFSVMMLPVTQGAEPPLVQPVSIVYDGLDGLPTNRYSRALFAWIGDMDIGSHFWRLARHRGYRATILLHEPLDPRHFADRKALAQAVWEQVASGAAALRQNRAPRPAAPSLAAPVEDDVHAAFA